DLWQTRLIIIEIHWLQQSAEALRRAAHLLISRGGPAVWLIDRDAPLLQEVYENIVHDRPFDWTAAQAPDAPALLFAGAGREEALRISAIAERLMRTAEIPLPKLPPYWMKHGEREVPLPGS